MINVFEVERRGYQEGTNPMMGEFKSDVYVENICFYDKRWLIKNIQKEMEKIKYIFYGKIKTNIILFYNEKMHVEEQNDATFDRIVKSVCQCLKGSQGIYIDKCQIEKLDIAQVETNDEPKITIEIYGNIDEYVMKPLMMYEMPDGLFYPISLRIWSRDGIKDIDNEQKGILLASIYKITKELTYSNYSGSYTLNDLMITSNKYPMLNGFSKENVVRAGFDCCYLCQWSKDKAFRVALKRLA